MEVKAKARFIRMSPRKIRLVVNVVRGLPVEQALTQLKFMKKHAALPVSKLLSSAIANAEHNFKLKRENLFVKIIMADGGPTLHRWIPRAQGRATPIRKRTTHISIVLGELKEAPIKKPKKNVESDSTEKSIEKKKAPASKKGKTKADKKGKTSVVKKTK